MDLSLIFNLILLIEASVFMLIPCGFYYHNSIVKLAVRGGGASNNSFIIQVVFAFLSPDFPYKVENCLCMTVKNDWRGLQWICRLLLVEWTSFLCCFYLSMNMGDLSISGIFFSSFFKDMKFYYTCLLGVWLELSQDLLYYLRLLWKVLFSWFLSQPTCHLYIRGLLFFIIII